MTGLEMMVAVHPALKMLQLSPLESYVFCSERLNPVMKHLQIPGST